MNSLLKQTSAEPIAKSIKGDKMDGPISEEKETGWADRRQYTIFFIRNKRPGFSVDEIQP